MAGKNSGMDVNSINRGRLRHPLYGNRGHWYDTRVKVGIIDRAADSTREQVRQDVLKAIDTATKQFRAKHH